MADEDRSNFFAERLTGEQWDYAAALLDDIHNRLRTVLNGLGTGVITVLVNGQSVGERGAIDFRGEIIVNAEDDASGDRIILTLPDYDPPVALGNALAEGTSTNLPRADHVHKRDVRVKVAGVDIGTRNALNFIAGFSAVDDATGDEVEITASAGGAGLVPLTTVIAGVPDFVWDEFFNLVMAEGG